MKEALYIFLIKLIACWNRAERRRLLDERHQILVALSSDQYFGNLEAQGRMGFQKRIDEIDKRIDETDRIRRRDTLFGGFFMKENALWCKLFHRRHHVKASDDRDMAGWCEICQTWS